MDFAVFLAAVSVVAPAAGQRAADTSTSDYVVAGVHIIQRRSAANDIVAVNAYFLGGTRLTSFANAGIEPFLLAVSERGTARYSREDIRKMLARSGSTIVVSAERDWSILGLRTTVGGLRDAWAAFSERIIAPRLDEADIAAERTQALAGIAQRQDSPDEWAAHLADSVAFAGHPYGIDPAGTARSITGLTATTLRAFHREQFVKTRLLLVIVGDVPRLVVDSLVEATLGRLPAGNYRWSLPDTMARRPTSVYREARALPTNYVVGYAPGPRADDPDYDALRVACAILGGRLFAEVRSRRTLTYAVDAPFAERAVSAAGLYVSTTDPVATLAAMRDEVRALQEMQIDGRSLLPLVQQFITEYFLSNETNAAQAGFLARSLLYRGDAQAGSTFASKLRAVTPADIQRVMRRYFHDLAFAYVGDPAKLPNSALDWR